MRSRFSASRDEHHVDVAAGPDQREALQQMIGTEVLAGGDELGLVGGTLLGVEPAPRRIHLEEGVLDEVPLGCRRSNRAHFRKYR